MGVTRSILDHIAKRLTPTIRKMHDIDIEMTGSKIEGIVIKVTESNALGDDELAVVEDKEFAGYIKYPNEIVIFRNRDENGNYIEDNAVYLEEILPTELFVPFEDSKTVEDGDILIYILFDEKDNPQPQIYRISQARGQYNSRYLVMKKFIIAHIRNFTTEEIWTTINNYVTNFNDDRIYNP